MSMGERRADDVQACHVSKLLASGSLEKSNDAALFRQKLDIKQDLLSLGNVISALDKRSIHIPYRDSKLTMLLKGSLSGGNSCKIILLACIAPKICDVEQSIECLRFVSRAKNLRNKVVWPTQPIITLPVKASIAQSHQKRNSESLPLQTLNHKHGAVSPKAVGSDPVLCHCLRSQNLAQVQTMTYSRSFTEYPSFRSVRSLHPESPTAESSVVCTGNIVQELRDQVHALAKELLRATLHGHVLDDDRLTLDLLHNLASGTKALNIPQSLFSTPGKHPRQVSPTSSPDASLYDSSRRPWPKSELMETESSHHILINEAIRSNTKRLIHSCVDEKTSDEPYAPSRLQREGKKNFLRDSFGIEHNWRPSTSSFTSVHDEQKLGADREQPDDHRIPQGHQHSHEPLIAENDADYDWSSSQTVLRHNAVRTRYSSSLALYFAIFAPQSCGTGLRVASWSLSSL